MKQRIGKCLFGLSTVAIAFHVNIADAVAQITESEKDYVPGTNETSQLITSSFEVRRAVIALIIIAALAVIGLVFYWRKTGQWARDRFIEEHGADALKKRKKPSRGRKFSSTILKRKDKSLFPSKNSDTSDSVAL